MKIAVTSTGADLGAEVDPRFGRCRYLMIVDPESRQWEAVENWNAQATSGAGPATAQTVVDKGAEVLITGECGPKAAQALAAGGVRVITGVKGTVEEVVEAYRDGRLPGNQEPAMLSSSGQGTGRVPGSGRGGMSGGPGRGGSGPGGGRGAAGGRAGSGLGRGPGRGGR